MRIWGVLTVFVLTCGMALASGKVDFSRYETILSRKPFGEPPADPSAAAPAANPATSFVKDIRMCAITETPEFGIRVGFVDIVAKKNYYLSVGDAEDGIQLVDADYEKEAALLQKGGEAYWINMTGQVNAGSGVPNRPASAMPASALPDPTTSIAMARKTAYAERVKQRREAMEAKRKDLSEAVQGGKGGQMAKRLQEYQMDMIRAGGEKGMLLPLPLTKEMDDQLVAEGVLPPADLSGENPAEAAPVENASPPEPGAEGVPPPQE